MTFSALALFALLIPLMVSIDANAASSANYSQDMDVLSGGGGASSSTNYRNTATIGQSSPLGEAVSAGFINHSGFWHAGAVRHRLEITTAGTGTGTVTVDPGSLLWNGSTGVAFYHNGIQVALTATPGMSTTFIGWSGDGDCADGSVTMDTTKNCVATFDLTTYTVTPSAGAGGTIAPNIAQIVVSGATASFMVTADSGYQVASVTGCGGTWTGNPYVTGPVSGDCSVNASFTPLPQYSLDVAKRGNGSITSTPAGIDCGTTCGASFYENTLVTLVATPAAGWNFVGWAGDADCSDGTVTMTANTNCTAVFAAPAKIGVYAGGYWYLDANQSWDWNGVPPDVFGIFGIGLGNATPVTGDWTGSGSTGIGMFNNGTWYLDANSNWQWDGNSVDILGAFGVGMPGAVPVVGDWNGDGITEIGVYADGHWYLDMNNNWTWDGEPTDVHGVFGIGLPNPVPVTGDWNADGITEIGIYSDGNWYLDKNQSWQWDGVPTDTFGQFGTGLPNPIPVTGDWNGDGTTKIGIYSEGNWYLDANASWQWDGVPTDTYGVFGIGLGTVVPVTGNW